LESTIKRIIVAICVALLLPTLVCCSSCDNGEGDNVEYNFKMKARVERVADVIEVDVIEGEYGASGVFWVVTSEKTVFLDREGKSITKHSLKKGDTVEIFYTGQVMMSFPPKIVAGRIVLQ